jgi:hypothetical protein
VVDLSPQCIERCRERFRQVENIDYHVNDGSSLEMVADDSIDFAFSFDSLVHAEKEVIQAYLQQLAKKLRRNGVGFLHHSNLGEYSRYFSLLKRAKAALRKPRPDGPPASSAGQSERMEDTAPKPDLASSLSRVARSIGLDSDRSRALSMTADAFDSMARDAGLRCLVQEKINWGTRLPIDCISVFTRADSEWPDGRQVYENREFMAEARLIAAVNRLYRITGPR